METLWKLTTGGCYGPTGHYPDVVYRYYRGLSFMANVLFGTSVSPVSPLTELNVWPSNAGVGDNDSWVDL